MLRSTPNSDPNQGRWVSPDPAGLAAVDRSNPQSWNRYGYVLNSPTNLADPYGMCSQIRDADGNFHCYGSCPQCTSSTWFGWDEFEMQNIPVVAELQTTISVDFSRPAIDELGNFTGDVILVHFQWTGWQTVQLGNGLDIVDSGDRGEDFFSEIWDYLRHLPLAGGIFVPLPYTAGTVSVMIPLAWLPSQDVGCAGLGLAATTPTGKYVSGGPLLFGDLSKARDILSGWGYNFGAQVAPLIGGQVAINKSGALAGPTLATATGLSAGYGWSYCGQLHKSSGGN